MINPYQRDICKFLLRRPSLAAPVMVNTVELLTQALQKPTKGARLTECNEGVASEKTAAQIFLRNMDAMNDIGARNGVRFMSFLQPVAGYGAYELNEKERASLRRKGQDYERGMRAFYDEVRAGIASRPYMHDMSSIFEGRTNAYLPDGRHVTSESNSFIAAQVLEKIQSQGFWNAYQ